MFFFFLWYRGPLGLPLPKHTFPTRHSCDLPGRQPAVEQDHAGEPDGPGAGTPSDVAPQRCAPVDEHQEAHDDEAERLGHRDHGRRRVPPGGDARSEEHTSELQSLMRSSYAVFCFKKKKYHNSTITIT